MPIYQWVTNADGQPITVQLIDSDLHVYTRLSLRLTVSAQDRQNQTATFTDILNRVVH